ncbi:MAG: hypothetical protein PVJ53_02555 [Desulfobacterales bacterium]|jgi:hypothetical protein
MSDIRMTTEMRTDYDCETTGMPAERWGEAVFTVGDQEIAIEISVEQDVIVAVMVGEDAAWKGTLEGFRRLLRSGLAP